MYSRRFFVQYAFIPSEMFPTKILEYSVSPKKVTKCSDNSHHAQIFILFIYLLLLITKSGKG